MVILSIDYAKKLRQIRKAEGLTQKQFADITGLSLATIRNYESGQKNARAKIVEAVLQVDRFEKYMLWLIKDKTLPVAGQIAPALSLMDLFSRRAIRFQSVLPKNHPDQAAMLADSTH